VPKAVKAHYKHLKMTRKSEQLEKFNKSRELKLELQSEEWNATQIQRVWRGYKDLRYISAFLVQKRSWLEQRNVDAHLRKELGYQTARLCGRGQLLESDTARETVMKKVPMWSCGTIADIILGRSLLA